MNMRNMYTLYTCCAVGMLPSLRGLGWENFSSSSSGPSAQKREPPAADDGEDLVHIVHNVTELDSAVRTAVTRVFSLHAPRLTPVVHNALVEHESYVPLMYSGTLAVLDGSRVDNGIDYNGLDPNLMGDLVSAVKHCHGRPLQLQGTSHRMPIPRIYHVVRLRPWRWHTEWAVHRWVAPESYSWELGEELSRQQHPNVFENMERLANEHYKLDAGEPHQRARMS